MKLLDWSQAASGRPVRRSARAGGGGRRTRMRAFAHLGGAALLLAAAAACAPSGQRPRQGPVSLPADAVQGAGDPARAAILEAAHPFGNPARLAGRPAEAARAVADLEYLPSEIPNGPPWREF